MDKPFHLKHSILSIGLMELAYLEVIHGDSHGVKDVGIDSVILQVDDVHLLPNCLKRCLRAQCCQISTHMPMCFIGNLQPQTVCVDSL